MNALRCTRRACVLVPFLLDEIRQLQLLLTCCYEMLAGGSPGQAAEHTITTWLTSA